MRKELESWLLETASTNLVIAPDNINLEAQENCWQYSFSSVEKYTPDEVACFFKSVLKAKSTQVVGRMSFYVWCDEQAQQLRYCISSVSKTNLPFGCEVKLVESLREVIDLYFSINNDGIIPFEELEETSLDEDFFDEEENSYILSVWC
jgi:hypothetical protein